MVLFLDSTSKDKMVIYQDAGVCQNGNYAEKDGLRDLQSCFEQCLAEPECMYVSFLDDGASSSKSTCSRFNNRNCGLSLSLPYDAKRYVTYQKIKKGAFKTRFFTYTLDTR